MVTRIQLVCKHWRSLARGAEVAKATMSVCTPQLLDEGGQPDVHRENHWPLIAAHCRIMNLCIERANLTTRTASESDPLLGLKCVALTLVKQDPIAFKVLSSSMQNDMDVILAAVESKRQMGRTGRFKVLEHVPSDDIKSNKEFVIRVVSLDGSELEHVPPLLREVREVVHAAVSCGAGGLRFAGRWRYNRETVLLAVSSRPSQLQFAGAALQSSREVVQRAMEGDPSAIEHAGPSAKHIADIVLYAVKRKPKMVRVASRFLRESVDFWCRAVEVAPAALEECYDDEMAHKVLCCMIPRKPELIRYRKVGHEHVLRAVRVDGMVLEYAPAEMRNSERIVSAAWKQNPDSVQFASQAIQDKVATDPLHLAALARQLRL